MSSVKHGGKSFSRLLCIGLVMVVIVVALDLVVELAFTVVMLSGSIKIIMAGAILPLVDLVIDDSLYTPLNIQEGDEEKSFCV